MKTSIRALPALALLSALGACTTIGDVLSPEPPRATVSYGFSQEDAMRSVNAFRARNGLDPLKTEPRLVQAAEAQSEAMARRNAMDHYVDGPLPARIKRFGYPFSTAAENIARGQRTFDAAMDGWEKSPGHRRNLLDPKMTEAGFAAVQEETTGRVFWTQIFARPREGSPREGPAAGPTLTFGGLQIRSQ